MKPRFQTCTLFALIFLLQLSMSVDGLFCYRCLNLDCPGDDIDCQRIRSFVQSELKNLYYFNSYLDPCPPLNDTYTWRMMQLDDEPCPEQKAGEATCTLGRMQVKTNETDKNGKSNIRYTHATVLGCANRQLLHNIKNAYEEGGACYLTKRNQSSVGIKRELEIEHCREISSQCFHEDYCVDFKHSIVKVWPDSKSDAKFEFSLIIGMLAVVVIVMSALLIAGMFKEPTSRLSNLPKSIGDDCEAVKVLNVREKKDMSIEDRCRTPSSFNGGTLPRRPSHPPPPPPPPPRLNRQISRGSTPV